MRHSRLTVIAALGALALAGCSSTQPSDKAPTSTPAAPTTSSAPPAPTTAAAPKPGDEVPAGTQVPEPWSVYPLPDGTHVVVDASAGDLGDLPEAIAADVVDRATRSTADMPKEIKNAAEATSALAPIEKEMVALNKDLGRQTIIQFRYPVECWLNETGSKFAYEHRWMTLPLQIGSSTAQACGQEVSAEAGRKAILEAVKKAEEEAAAEEGSEPQSLDAWLWVVVE